MLAPRRAAIVDSDGDVKLTEVSRAEKKLDNRRRVSFADDSSTQTESTQIVHECQNGF